ncbi:hypothetical protein [Mesorhizobium sp. RMAD-H1]|uniref:hypothetical protein n=1 Tax=Mesorhizobium sp. RMAD-H1 TaxID=2587065 RepID=UPI0016135EDF|nr:hypothetical protein [Mesorhizobium sp. RMAD-H1]MBB2969870.1 hypothetical protein [Mesorhizobium sp. RMAD-H1]
MIRMMGPFAKENTGMASFVQGTLLRGLACIVVATAAALTTHIIAQAWAQDIGGPLMEGFVPPTGAYSRPVIAAAYATAFMTMGFTAVIYYWVADRLPVTNSPMKVLVVAIALLALKGELIRMPIMNAVTFAYYGAHAPISAALLLQADKWAANIVLAICLVYLCPVRKRQPELADALMKSMNALSGAGTRRRPG